MRWCDIATGILLILSIIDFALAAPVLEKHQARLDVPFKFRKRLDEALEKLGEEYFETSGKSIDSSGTHLSLSPAPSGPDYGSTSGVQPPPPHPASSTSDPNPSIEPSCSPPSSSMQGLSARGSSLGKTCLDLLEDTMSFEGPYGMRGGGPVLYYASKYDPYSRLAAMEAPAPQSIPSLSPSADPNFDRDHWVNVEDPPSSSTADWRPARPKLDVGEPSGHAPGPPPESLPVVAEPPTYPDPEIHLDDQSLSAGSQPADFQTALYAAKGKAKQFRRFSGIQYRRGCWDCGPEGVATR